MAFEEPRILPLKTGTDYGLEEEANRLLAASREQFGDQHMVLSEEQLELRQKREISNSLGVADASLVAGMYRRAHNPLAGTRPGKLGRSHDDG